jgi:SAM-dependent methyltransferase
MYIFRVRFLIKLPEAIGRGYAAQDYSVGAKKYERLASSFPWSEPLRRVHQDMMTTYLNLGCGSRFNPDWVNVDFVSNHPGIILCNLRAGIPFQDRTFDVVYHSHLLEHFTRDEANNFIQECKRVLKPSGIIRVVVPDLEAIARAYLVALESARKGVSGGKADYSWMIIEMLDQLVRNKPGGLMLSYLQNENIPNVRFILQRCGLKAKEIIDRNKNYNQIYNSNSKIVSGKIVTLIRAFRYPGIMKNKLIKVLLGKEYFSYEIARFRNSGEVHQWMYDDYSLKRLLEENGFISVVRRAAVESYIKEWASFNLDTEPDGTIYKPDSLYVEAIIE